MCFFIFQFYAYVALRSLILIVEKPSLHEFHREALANIGHIFAKLDTECIPYLQNVIPPLLRNLRSFHNASQRAMLLQQLTNIINIVRAHIRTHLNRIFELIHALWNENAYVLAMIHTLRYFSHCTLSLSSC